MQISKFNRILKEICSTSINLNCAKSLLFQNSKSQIMMAICQFDNDKKGWLKKEDILEFIGKKGANAEQQRIKLFLQQKFTCQKISYTMLLAICQNQFDWSQSSQKNINLDKKQPEYLVSSILLCLSCLYSLIPEVLTLLPKYILFSGNTIIVDDIAEYVYSQNLALDPNHILSILNNRSFTNEKNKQLCLKYFKENEQIEKKIEEQDNDQRIMELKAISERLIKRVENFGKEWLINMESNNI